ncbi:MAG: hypothetical protein FWE44_03610 [Defluviitaleaceae bacterium]|nr:hypothetical protein [Defluviitaleaceae bacterium]
MIEVGQVLALKIRFKNTGETARDAHPCIVVGVSGDGSHIEVAQFSSLAGKEFKAIGSDKCKVIYHDNPTEAVIDRDSFAQLDSRFTIEHFPELINFRRQTDKLSDDKLKSLIKAYNEYPAKFEIDENRIVHMTESEIKQLNG